MSTPRRTYTFPKPGGQKMIDARATRRDMSGNVISQPGEKAFTGVRRDMSGNPISGKLIATGATMQFPQPGGSPARSAAGSGSGAFLGVGGTAPAFPKPSGMTTGNSAAHFQGADERLADMNAREAGRVAAVNRAVAARTGRPDGSEATSEDQVVNLADVSAQVQRERTPATGNPVAVTDQKMMDTAQEDAVQDLSKAANTAQNEQNLAARETAGNLRAAQSMTPGTGPTRVQAGQVEGATIAPDAQTVAPAPAASGYPKPPMATEPQGQPVPYGRDPQTGRKRGFPVPRSGAANGGGAYAQNEEE